MSNGHVFRWASCTRPDPQSVPLGKTSLETRFIPSLQFYGHFSRWTKVRRYRMSPFWISLEVLVTTGTISGAKIPSNHHHQQTNNLLFTGQMPFLSPKQQSQSTERNAKQDSLQVRQRQVLFLMPESKNRRHDSTTHYGHTRYNLLLFYVFISIHLTQEHNGSRKT